MSSTKLVVSAEAPANIALIKYMGKVTAGANLPVNSSLSYTLNHLRTVVSIAPIDGTRDEWQPLKPAASHAEWIAPMSSKLSNESPNELLSEPARERYLKHFQFLKNEFDIANCSLEKLSLQKFGSPHFVIRSANNFPSDCGVASSASSFAALTLATYELAKKLNPRLDVTRSQLAELSRQGSGSSIRSFYSPFAIWQTIPGHSTSCTELKSIFEPLHHQLVVVSQQKKLVSSSEAHRRVISSPLFNGRAERAEERLRLLQIALGLNEVAKVDMGGASAANQDASLANWRRAYEIVTAEFWDMHSLFHTAKPSFRYITASTLAVIDEVDTLWERTGDGPLVTLDAGPNVHLLYRANQIDLAREFAERALKKHGEVIEEVSDE